MAPIQINGVRLFTASRACAGPLAVVLHGFGSGLEILDLEMQRCPRPKPLQSPGCHTSYHYGVGPGGFHQYVDQANTAWGFGVVQPTCPGSECDPTPCESCTGVTADQYNTDIDGNPPTLPVWVAGPDGTVNCAVIHVAVTGMGNGSDQDCCAIFQNPKTYQALVAALCNIFTEAGLTPTQTTLLVHCEELICVDIDQLVLDVAAYDCDVAVVNGFQPRLFAAAVIPGQAVNDTVIDITPPAVSSGIPFNGTSDYFTLLAGRTYQLTATLNVGATLAGAVTFTWVDNVTELAIGAINTPGTLSAINTSVQSLVTIAPTVNTNIKLLASGSTLTLTGGLISISTLD